MTSLARFSVNQMTVRQLSMPELVAACRETGVPGVGLWREPVRSYGLGATAKLVHDAGLAVTTLCRGGFLTAIDPGERRRALDDNRAAVDEAAVLGTDTLVLVSGGLPPGSKDLRGARERIADALGELGPYAASHGVRLAVEPLHPMYAADRCVVSTLAQALDLAERFPAEQVGVTVDTYHLWWDDTAPAQIARAGAGAGSTASSSPTGPPRFPRVSSTAAASSATARSTSACGAAWSRRRVTPDPSRSNSSTRSCGPGTGARCWRRRRHGSWSTWSDDSGTRDPGPGPRVPLSSDPHRPRTPVRGGDGGGGVARPWGRRATGMTVTSRSGPSARCTAPRSGGCAPSSWGNRGTRPGRSSPGPGC